MTHKPTSVTIRKCEEWRQQGYKPPCLGKHDWLAVVCERAWGRRYQVIQDGQIKAGRPRLADQARLVQSTSSLLIKSAKHWAPADLLNSPSTLSPWASQSRGFCPPAGRDFLSNFASDPFPHTSASIHSLRTTPNPAPKDSNYSPWWPGLPSWIACVFRSWTLKLRLWSIQARAS